MAEIREIHGNIFQTDCGVIVNTVNCVGVMGAGMALECKLRFQGLFERYESECQSGAVAPGTLSLFESKDGVQILNFPTKKHWKDPSRLEYVQAGLTRFAEVCLDWGIDSVAFPHLGCSHGGLGWEQDVRPIMFRALEPLEHVRVDIYSFDPSATDALYDSLEECLRGMSPNDVGDMCGLRPQQVNRLLESMESGQVHNMGGLARSKGVGEATLAKVYDVAGAYRRGEPREQQLGFSFGD